ncbi:MAG: serine/threonine-protein phosphatase [Spirochaetaceae bacterium]|nr:MAG: serine/threonine-protein phosphatase [Spirochaetaceae bacterium]
MTLEIVALSDIGLVRATNEDMAVVGRTFVRDGVFSAVEEVDNGTAMVLGVADGVGGGNAGEIASQYVIEQLTYRINTLECALGEDQLETAVREACLEAHNALLRKGIMNPRYEGMATTATLLFHYDGRWYVTHAGDSRFYFGSADGFRRVSRDHTLREFTGDPRIPGNILVNCFGSQDEFFADFFRVDNCRAAGDVFLVCSDGLSDMVDDQRIWDILCNSTDITSAGYELMDSAKAGGGRDNITFVAARVQ